MSNLCHAIIFLPFLHCYIEVFPKRSRACTKKLKLPFDYIVSDHKSTCWCHVFLYKKWIEKYFRQYLPWICRQPLWKYLSLPTNGYQIKNNNCPETEGKIKIHWTVVANQYFLFPALLKGIWHSRHRLLLAFPYTIYPQKIFDRNENMFYNH